MIRKQHLDGYTRDLGNVIDMDPIRGAKINLGVDPLGGADVYRGPIGNGCSLGLTVVKAPKQVSRPQFHVGAASASRDCEGEMEMDQCASGVSY